MKTLTKEEAFEAVKNGADNVMVKDYFEDGCECHEEGCWVGVQQGDEDENGEWPEHWGTFQLW